MNVEIVLTIFFKPKVQVIGTGESERNPDVISSSTFANNDSVESCESQFEKEEEQEEKKGHQHSHALKAGFEASLT